MPSRYFNKCAVERVPSAPDFTVKALQNRLQGFYFNMKRTNQKLWERIVDQVKAGKQLASYTAAERRAVRRATKK